MQGFTRDYRGIEVITYTRVYKDLQGITRDYGGFQGAWKGLHGFTRIYKSLQRLYKGLQGYTRDLQGHGKVKMGLQEYTRVYGGYTRIYKGLHYTCQLFLRYKRAMFILEVLAFLRTTRSYPKIPEEVQSLPKTSEVFRTLRTRINASSLPVLFTSKIEIATQVL